MNLNENAHLIPLEIALFHQFNFPDDRVLAHCDWTWYIASKCHNA